MDLDNMSFEFERPMRGIVQHTGGHDTSKTTSALECGVNPLGIAYIEDDIKGHATVEDMRSDGLEFGLYLDLQKEKREGKIASLIDYHNLCLDMIEKAIKAKLPVLVWDTWTEFEKTTHEYVLANLTKFRRANEWNHKGDIKGAEQWQEARKYEASLLHYLQSNFTSVQLTTHLKKHRINGKETGKMIPDNSPTLDRVCIARFWYLKNPKSSVPIALVLKRPSKKVYVDGVGLRTVNILPHRMVPREGQYSIWDMVEYYYANPMGNRAPTLEETPNAFELSIIQNTLTPDMKHMFELSIADMEPELPAKPQTTEERVKELSENGYTHAQIAEAVGVPLPVVTALLT